VERKSTQYVHNHVDVPSLPSDFPQFHLSIITYHGEGSGVVAFGLGSSTSSASTQ